MTRVGIIGCGRWGPNHLRVMSRLSNCEVSAVADPDKERLARVRAIARNVRLEHEYQSLTDDPELDAVVVAVPTRLHFTIVRDALRAGKHVLCEKPLCYSPAEGDELVALAAERGLVLMVGHVFLFNPGVVKVKELVDAGELGSPYYLSATRTNLGPVRSDVNSSYDLASHDIAVFNWLLGAEPEAVSATGASYLQPNIEDVVVLTLRYPKGVIGSIRASWLDPKKVREMTVVGSSRMLTWDDLQLSTPVAIYDKGVDVSHEYGSFGEFLRLATREGDVRLPKVEPTEPLELQDRHFLEAVERRTGARSDGLFGLGVVRALDAAEQSLKSGGIPVAVSTPCTSR